MSDQENTPETDPPPAGSGKRRPPPAPDTTGNTDPQERPFPQDAPAEPEIVSPGDLELSEPELESPAISAEAAEAASLDTAAAEAAAVEADAAEAGRLAAPGQPAPAGTEIPDNAGGETPGTADGEAPDTAGRQTPTPEPQAQAQAGDAPTSPGNGPAATPGGATAVSGDSHTVPEHTVPAGPTAADPNGTASAVPKDPAPATGAPEATNRNLRILIAVGAVGIIAVLLVLLFTLLFDTKEDGVLSEDVEPVEVEQGACIQDFEDINSEVDVVTCETPHNSQLVATAEVEDADTYPGSEALTARVEEVCNAVEYSDAAAALPDIRLEKAIPTEESWRQGDRRVDCFVVSPQDLTQSLLR